MLSAKCAPPAGIELMPGVFWGAVDAFPTPAYWVFQSLNRRMNGAPLRYRLGRTLAEEVGACLLGGHGISAEVGLAAYERLCLMDAFNPKVIPTKEAGHGAQGTPATARTVAPIGPGQPVRQRRLPAEGGPVALYPLSG
jgi:hypothetical protein